MSYILDALRRADSERERGAIPNLHAKPVPAALADADEDDERSRLQTWVWAVIGLLLVLVAVLAWQFFSARAPEAAPVPALVQTPPAPVVTAPPLPLPPPPMPPPMPAPVAAVPPPMQATQRKPPSARPAPQPQVPASAAVDERPVLAFNDLPETIRRELPQLVIGGAMHSQTPASRMLILNGQVFHEGDKVAGELVLEQIKLKSAVLAYKGYRYSISY